MIYKIHIIDINQQYAKFFLQESPKFYYISAAISTVYIRCLATLYTYIEYKDTLLISLKLLYYKVLILQFISILYYSVNHINSKYASLSSL